MTDDQHWEHDGADDATAVSGFMPTKLTIPVAPPGLVDRERLFDLLDAGARGPLTLAAGPAGIGKTALVTSWIAAGRAPGPVAWLSLDATDDSRPRFWRLMLAAIAAISGDEMTGRLQVTSDQTVDAALPAVVGVLSDLRRPIVLVLDDFDEITDPAIMADLESLLRTPPPALRLVATARRTPSLRLQRLRLAGSVTEVDPRELVFTDAEATELLQAAGVQLADEQARVLWERTEGWAAGLRLTAMALRGRPDADAFVAQFAGDEAPVADYLFEEILSAQPAEIRDFLLRTAITDTITGGLADALTGQTGGGATLSELHQDGIMATALDDHREWFRYHGLFRGLLRSVLRREHPHVVPDLHRRAALWLIEHRREVEAARHALAAQDWELLADIVATASFALLARGELRELAAVLRAVPPARMQANPGFPLAGGALELGDALDAEPWMALADAGAAAGAVRPSDRATFEIGRAIIGLYHARLTGDADGAAADALTLMGGTRDARPDDFGASSELRALALINLGALELWTGRLDAAERDLAEGIVLAEARGLEYLELYGRAHLSVHRLWAGRVADADIEATAALELADRHSWRGTPRTSVALVVKGTVALLLGDAVAADELIAAARRSVARSVERPVRAHASLNAARLLRVQGRPDEALRAIDEVRADIGDSPFWAPVAISVAVQAGLALDEVGRRDEALAVLDEAIATAPGPAGPAYAARAQVRIRAGEPLLALADLEAGETQMEGPTAVIVAGACRLMRAVLEHQRGNDDAASTALEGALALAAEDGIRMFLLQADQQARGLLVAHLDSGTAYAPLIREILDARRDPGGPDDQLRAAPFHSSPEPPPSEELSDRELAVLRYLPTMLTNREIADELFVSVNTVKTHVKQIYRKLGAHDRRDAVTRARRVGLLTPVSSSRAR